MSKIKRSVGEFLKENGHQEKLGTFILKYIEEFEAHDQLLIRHRTFPGASNIFVEPPSTPSMGSKRGRLLMRQPRVKKDNSEHGDGEKIEFHRIERQISEPTPNLLTVPQQSYLIKQNSSPGPLATTYSENLSQPHQPKIKVAEEFRRALSTPQCSNEPCEAARACHCPVLRPGPALGCNFCWNTIDGHGRILRRKTKYHCPECQTNLCIVPCFQEYHERQNNTKPLTSGSSNKDPPSKEPILQGSLPTIMKTSSL